MALSEWGVGVGRRVRSIFPFPRRTGGESLRLYTQNPLALEDCGFANVCAVSHIQLRHQLRKPNAQQQQQLCERSTLLVYRYALRCCEKPDTNNGVDDDYEGSHNCDAFFRCAFCARLHLNVNCWNWTSVWVCDSTQCIYSWCHRGHNIPFLGPKHSNGASCLVTRGWKLCMPK